MPAYDRSTNINVRGAVILWMTQSTITNIFNHNTVPSIITLEAICKAFGITLAQFFAEDEMIELSDSLREFIKEWKLLTAKQKEALMGIMKAMH